ncbi:LCP family protein [Pseudonocardia acaciae]|uniref:LCP family protein n=1 Tax=Pseudonocardia acaciae TaxID=551276 RepID=UPI000B051B3F|nr:LCP family protein [Pseudonocardia acaciae]
MDQRPAPPAQMARRGLRAVMALLSTVVLVATGIGWRYYQDLSGGINTSDVITGGTQAAPGTDMNILLVGVDSRTDAQGRPLSKQVLAQLRSGAEEGVLNSDTIILLHVPANGGKATAISIPRDSYVDIPGYGKNKINSAYPQALMAASEKLRNRGGDEAAVDRDSRTAGRSELIKTVEKLTGVKIDHFAEVNLLGFFQLTNAIGGVEVCLKEAVKEFRSGANFKAGRQVISGGDALAFVRQRYNLPQSDFSRIRRQQVFLAAVAHKILSAGTLTSPSKLQGLIDTAKASVVLDSGWDILGFARQASNLAGGNLQFVTIPTAGSDSNSAGDVVLVEPDEVRRFVREQTGAAPDASTAPRPGGASSEKVPPGDITVDVRNGTGRGGLAGQVATKLTARGYQRGKLDNIEEPSTSTVHYPPGHSDAGEQVAELMGGMRTEEDSKVPADTVRVYLASDFSLSSIRSDDSSSSSSTRSSASSRASRSSAAPAPPTPPITADGVPCVD